MLGRRRHDEKVGRPGPGPKAVEDGSLDPPAVAPQRRVEPQDAVQVQPRGEGAVLLLFGGRPAGTERSRHHRPTTLSACRLSIRSRMRSSSAMYSSSDIATQRSICSMAALTCAGVMPDFGGPSCE